MMAGADIAPTEVTVTAGSAETPFAFTRTPIWRVAVAPAVSPFPSSAAAAAVVSAPLKDAVESAAPIDFAASDAAMVSSSDATAPAAATEDDAAAVAAAADWPDAAKTSALMGTIVTTVRDIEPVRERETVVPSPLHVGETRIDTLAPEAVVPVATQDPALAPGASEMLAVMAPADAIVDDDHELANELAVAASANTAKSSRVTLIVPRNAALTFCKMVTVAVTESALGAFEVDADAGVAVDGVTRDDD